MPTKIIAVRGTSIFMLEIGNELAVILNMERDRPVLSPPATIASHAKWGYWEDFAGDPAPILAAATTAIRTGEAREWARAVLPPDIDSTSLLTVRHE